MIWKGEVESGGARFSSPQHGLKPPSLVRHEFDRRDHCLQSLFLKQVDLLGDTVVRELCLRVILHRPLGFSEKEGDFIDFDYIVFCVPFAPDSLDTPPDIPGVIVDGSFRMAVSCLDDDEFVLTLPHRD